MLLTMPTPPTPPPHPIPASTAWLRAGGMGFILWMVLGIACFGIGATEVYERLGTSIHAAFVLDMIFVAGFLLVAAVTITWQRRTGGTLADLGWRRPFRKRAMVAAVIFGVLWTALTYAEAGDPLTTAWQRIPMILAAPVLAFGEEVARACLMDSLHRGGVSVWLQILVGGVVMASYHGFIGGNYSVTYAISSFVMFGLLSRIYVWGGRSLTPVLVGHALPHLLGDPSLTQGILIGLEAMR